MNDTLPDCSAAGLANAVLAVGALAGYETEILDPYVPVFYASVVGCPSTQEAMAATDGVTLLDALALATTKGIDVGQQVPLIPMAGTVATERAALAHAMSEFGCAYLGIRLYEQDMTGAALLDDSGVSTRGALVGGHCLLAWSYTDLSDMGIVGLATWGSIVNCTWRWLESRLDEAHGLFWRQLAPAQASAVDEDRLAAEIKSAT